MEEHLSDVPIKTTPLRVKGIHIKLDRQTHASFRIKLIDCGLSMQEAFEHFARLAGGGNPTALRMLNGLVRDKIKQEMATIGVKPYKPGTRRRLNELDPEKIYDLINEGFEHGDVDAVDTGEHDEAVE